MAETNSEEIFQRFYAAFGSGTMTRALEGEVQAWMSDPESDPTFVEVAKDLWNAHVDMGRPVVDGQPKPPSVIGHAFHNPYTFVPFPKNPPRRDIPTPLTVDEAPGDAKRFTGFLDLEIKLLSPLLSSKAVADRDDGGHKTYSALCVEDDVILPASGVRGALRTLLSLLTGGTLGYVDEEAWLCQGRDARLGPKPVKPTPQSHLLPDHCFLAEVVKPGGVHKSGTIRLGQTKLKDLRQIEGLLGSKVKSLRPKPGSGVQYVWVDENLTGFSDQPSERHPWKLKLSGRPINVEGKREGIFLPSDRVIELPTHLWAAYCGRNAHGDFGELKKGDLIWLEPKRLDAREITGAEDIKSIQWARWGREGERLLDVIAERHPHQIPDCLNPDGKVDEVTNLFGQIPSPPEKTREVLKWRDWTPGPELPGPAAAFAARVRPGNLVFEGAKQVALQRNVPLAPLSVPHPGCAAFYRQPHEGLEHTFHEDVANRFLGLRGFKVYRTTKEKNHDAPWKYENQGVYDGGRIKPARQKTNKTVDLLRDDKAPVGKLRLSLRALSEREIALLLAACAVDWRLGGGKPLGLGHCRVVKASLKEFKDDGSLQTLTELKRLANKIAEVPAPYKVHLDESLAGRMRFWQATQEPVPRLRYPRAVVRNREKINRGGHVWFNRHASPKKSGKKDEDPKGLEDLHVSKRAEGLLKGQDPHILPQPLPLFEADEPMADQLYGYDLYQDNERDREETTGTEKPSIRLEPFSPDRHHSPAGGGGENLSQNRERREQTREHRRS